MATIRELTRRVTVLEQQKKAKLLSSVKIFWTEIVTWGGLILKRLQARETYDRLILPPKEAIERSHEEYKTPPDEIGWAEEIERLDRELNDIIDIRIRVTEKE